MSKEEEEKVNDAKKFI